MPKPNKTVILHARRGQRAQHLLSSLLHHLPINTLTFSNLFSYQMPWASDPHVTANDDLHTLLFPIEAKDLVTVSSLSS